MSGEDERGLEGRLFCSCGGFGKGRTPLHEKMSTQLKNIDFTNHPAAADPVTLRAIQKAIALIELRFTPQGESH